MRANLLNKIQAFLLDKEYVWLKNLGHSRFEELKDSSDIDLLVTKPVLEQTLKFIKEQKGVKHIQEVKTWRMTQLFLFLDNSEFLQIDLLSGFFRKNLIYLDANLVLANRVKSKEVWICPLETQFEHVVLFNSLNFAGIPHKYVEFFKNTQRYVDVITPFNLKYKTNQYAIENFSFYNSSINEKIYEGIMRLDWNRGISAVYNKAIYMLDVGKTIRNQKGMVISFSGVDGAGKSTILDHVKNMLQEKYHKNVVVLRHRPSILPIISAWRYGKKEAEKKSVSKLPRQGTNKNKISSAFRFLYYYVDYIFGHLFVKLKYLNRGMIVLYDRYYFDFIIDGKRSNISLDNGLPKWLYRFVNKPDLNFFLHAKPEEILKRKEELSFADITELTDGYLELFNQFGQRFGQVYEPIENIEIEDTLNRIESVFISSNA